MTTMMMVMMIVLSRVLTGRDVGITAKTYINNPCFPQVAVKCPQSTFGGESFAGGAKYFANEGGHRTR